MTALAVALSGLFGALVLLDIATKAVADPTGALTVTVMDQDGKVLPSAIVAIAQGDGPPIPRPAADPIVIDQENTAFNPWVTAVAKGGSVQFDNSDPFGHHVYSFSRVKRFERTVGSQESSTPVRFEEAGSVPIGCNIHDDMLGFIMVVEDPLFETTPNSGVVRFDGLTAGTYRARLWHPRKRGRRWLEQEVTVTADQDNAIAITLPVREERQRRGRDRSNYR